MIPERILNRIKEYIKDTEECINYPILNTDGYASYQMWISGLKKHFLLHRVSFEYYNNIELKPIDIIMHSCDNRSCINPKHLKKGTHADNVADKMNKGRQAKGETNGRSKLKKEDIIEIRKSLSSNRTLADLYKIDISTVRNIKANKIWRDI